MSEFEGAIEIEITKASYTSRMVGLETEVTSLRNIIRQQADFSTRTVEILAKMEFLLARHSRHAQETSKSLQKIVLSALEPEKSATNNAREFSEACSTPFW